MLGMSGTLAYMNERDPGYEVIKQAYRRLVDKVEAYQLEGGLYSWPAWCKGWTGGHFGYRDDPVFHCTVT